MKTGHVAEHGLQKQIADVLRIEISPPGRVSEHGVTWFSIDHASYLGAAPGARTARGIVAGILDVLVLHGGRAGLIEIKTEAPNSILSLGQRNMIVTLLAAGCRVAAATCAEHVLAAIDEWDIPRRRVVRLPLKAA